MNEQTEVPVDDVEVTPIPQLFYWSLFIPAFFVMVYVFQLILQPRVALPPRDGEEPE